MIGEEWAIAGLGCTALGAIFAPQWTLARLKDALVSAAIAISSQSLSVDGHSGDI